MNMNQASSDRFDHWFPAHNIHIDPNVCHQSFQVTVGSLFQMYLLTKFLGCLPSSVEGLSSIRASRRSLSAKSVTFVEPQLVFSRLEKTKNKKQWCHALTPPALHFIVLQCVTVSATFPTAECSPLLFWNSFLTRLTMCPLWKWANQSCVFFLSFHHVNGTCSYTVWVCAWEHLLPNPSSSVC